MRIGVVLGGSAFGGAAAAASEAKALLALGFDCFELEFWSELGDADLPSLADAFAEAVGPGRVSALGVYGNTLSPSGVTLASIHALMDAAGSFGAPIVSCFAGRVPGKSVPESLEAWRAAFGDLAEKAAAKGLSIAMENCRLGDTWKTGKWNIAINPDAWELLFEALPGAPIGLEWEPAHQALALADPETQLAAWAGRVLHVHGKDARLDREALAAKGYFAAAKIGRECLPGEGDGDWAAMLGILESSGYRGSVELELPAGGAGDQDDGSPGRLHSRLSASLAYLRRASIRPKPAFEAGTRLA